MTTASDAKNIEKGTGNAKVRTRVKRIVNTGTPIADVFVVWAKCEDAKIRGFILEKVRSSKKCCPSLCDVSAYIL